MKFVVYEHEDGYLDVSKKENERGFLEQLGAIIETAVDIDIGEYSFDINLDSEEETIALKSLENLLNNQNFVILFEKILALFLDAAAKIIEKKTRRERIKFVSFVAGDMDFFMGTRENGDRVRFGNDDKLLLKGSSHDLIVKIIAAVTGQLAVSVPKEEEELYEIL